MEDRKIKSSFEIAMEKVAKMTDLTPQEIKEQKEHDYTIRGKAIANRYLTGAIKKQELSSELKKFQGEEHQIVRKATLSFLCQAIHLDNMEKSYRAMDGFESLGIQFNSEEMKIKFEEIQDSFKREYNEIYRQFEESRKDTLNSLGISGSAVVPDVEASEDFQNAIKQLRPSYNAKIEKLIGKILE